METERAKRLAGFVSWVGANIKGDEKGEAQVFLDRFLQAFGHAGLKEAGATLEEQIKKTDGKGTAFADLVWKPVVLIEAVEQVSGSRKAVRNRKRLSSTNVPDIAVEKVSQSKSCQEPKTAFFDQCARYRFLTPYLPRDRP
jgi:hypothetical protein